MCYSEEEYEGYFERSHNLMLRQVSRPKSRLYVLLVDLPREVVAKYVRRVHPDVVADDKECVSALFIFLKSEMGLLSRPARSVSS